MEGLEWAIENGDLDKVKEVLDKDAKLAGAQLNNGRYPLCVAADYGQKEIIDYLIKMKADVNCVDKHGLTPLLSAIYEGHTESVKLLLDKGASKLGKAPDGSAYIDCAENEEIKALLQ